MNNNWIPCSEKMPTGDQNEIWCLVTCREWDIFGGYGNSKVRVLSYMPKSKLWNVKSMLKVEAWMPLPEPYKYTERNDM